MTKKKFETKAEPKDHRNILTEKVIALMENAGTWKKSWIEGLSRPFNPVTGTRYRGINMISLITENRKDPRFLTFNNIKQLAASTETDVHLKKGAHGVPIFKVIMIAPGDKDEGLPSSKSNKEEDVGGKRSFRVYSYAGTVFNAEDIENMPALVDSGMKFDPVEHAELLIDAMKVEGGLGWDESAMEELSYSPIKDMVYMPPREHFTSPLKFYANALHEIGHATGHPSRLNRPMKGRANLEAYAYEELIAELNSYFMAAELGIEYDQNDHKNHASYLQGWIKAMKANKNILFSACASASKACDYQMLMLSNHMANVADINNIDSSKLDMQVSMEEFQADFAVDEDEMVFGEASIAEVTSTEQLPQPA